MDRDVGCAPGRVFNVYVALNMLLCSILFFPWALPRETICGLMGRWLNETGRKRDLAKALVPFLDRYFHSSDEPCSRIAEQEARIREILYC